jgi:hypothetical protein
MGWDGERTLSGDKSSWDTRLYEEGMVCAYLSVLRNCALKIVVALVVKVDINCGSEAQLWGDMTLEIVKL